MVRKVKFGILGLGRGKKTALSVAQAAGAALVCVCDLQESLAQNTAQELGCNWTTNYDEMVARNDIEVVGIYTSSGTHVDFASKAISHGKHVFLTKPMDIPAFVQLLMFVPHNKNN